MAGDTDVGTQITFDHMILSSIDHGALRVGQLRKNLYKATSEDIWKEAKTNLNDDSIKFAGILNLEKPAHVNALNRYAQIKVEKENNNNNISTFHQHYTSRL